MSAKQLLEYTKGTPGWAGERIPEPDTGDSSMIIFDLILRYEKYSLLVVFFFFSRNYVIYLGRVCAVRQGLTKITHLDRVIY